MDPSSMSEDPSPPAHMNAWTFHFCVSFLSLLCPPFYCRRHSLWLLLLVDPVAACQTLSYYKASH